MSEICLITNYYYNIILLNFFRIANHIFKYNFVRTLQYMVYSINLNQ